MVPQEDSPKLVVHIAGATTTADVTGATYVVVAAWYQELYVLVRRTRSVSVYVVV